MILGFNEAEALKPRIDLVCGIAIINTLPLQ